MKKKYYDEIKDKIDESLKKKDYDFAIKLINEEISMPYIPMEFENYLIETLKKIPLNNNEERYTFTIEKIIDLLIKLDDDKNDYSELINQLNKFNLEKNLNEITYFFLKAKNKKNISLVFDELCKQKTNVILDLGNPSEIESIEETVEYIRDKKKMELTLDKYPLLIEPGNELLKEIYLTKHFGQKLEEGFDEVVVYTLSKLFSYPDLLKEIKDLKNIQNKLKMFSSINNL